MALTWNTLRTFARAPTMARSPLTIRAPRLSQTVLRPQGQSILSMLRPQSRGISSTVVRQVAPRAAPMPRRFPRRRVQTTAMRNIDLHSRVEILESGRIRAFIFSIEAIVSSVVTYFLVDYIVRLHLKYVMEEKIKAALEEHFKDASNAKSKDASETDDAQDQKENQSIVK